MGCSPPGSPVHGSLQARVLEGAPCPPPGGLPDPGIELTALALAGGSPEPPGEPVMPAAGPPVQWRVFLLALSSLLACDTHTFPLSCTRMHTRLHTCTPRHCHSMLMSDLSVKSLLHLLIPLAFLTCTRCALSLSVLAAFFLSP